MGNEQQRLSQGVFSVIGNRSEWESEVALGKMHLVRNRLSKQRGQAYSTSWTNPSKQVTLYQMRHSRCEYVVQVYAVLPQQTGILGTSQEITVITERIPFRLTDISILTYPQALYMLKCVLEGARCIGQFVKGVVYGQEMICINGEGKCKLWVNECIATNNCQQDEAQNGAKKLMELIQLKMGDKYNYAKTRLMDNPKTIEQNIVFVEKLIAQFPQKIDRIDIKMSNPESRFQSSPIASKKLDEERSSSRLLRPQEYNLPKTSKLPPRPKKGSAEKSLTSRKSSAKEKGTNSLIKCPSNAHQPSTMSFIANSPSLAKPIVSLRLNSLDSSPKLTEQKIGCFRPSPQQLSPFEIYKLKAMGQINKQSTITRNSSPQYYPSSTNIQFTLPKDMSPRDNIFTSNSTQALPKNPLLNLKTPRNKRIENNPIRFAHISPPPSSSVFDSSNSNIVQGRAVYGTGMVSFNRFPFEK